MARPESLAVLDEASQTLAVEESSYLLNIKYLGELNKVSVLRLGVSEGDRWNRRFRSPVRQTRRRARRVFDPGGG